MISSLLLATFSKFSITYEDGELLLVFEASLARNTKQ
jgi:hypothetical protein